MLMLLCMFTVKCVAQDVQSYIGDSKIFMLPNWGNMYAAQTYDWTGDGLNNIYYYSSLSFIQDGIITSYSSSHGKYIEFKYFYLIVSGRYATCEQVVFGTSTGNGSGYYAFVIKGKELLLVDVTTDAVISILDADFKKGSDLSIYVYDPSKVNDRIAPQIWVVNNGYVKIFNGFPDPTSVNGISSGKSTTERKYNLNGIEVETPSNGVYIQNGKKHIAK